MGGAQQVFVREPGARPEHGWRVLGTWLTTLLFSALRLARLPHPSSSPGGGAVFELQYIAVLSYRPS